MQIHGTKKKNRALKKRASWWLQEEGCLKGFGFLQQKYYCILFLSFTMGSLLRGWGLSDVRDNVVSQNSSSWEGGEPSPSARPAQRSPRWAPLGGNGGDTGLEAWPGNTFGLVFFFFSCWFWAIPPPLFPWRFTVLNFLFCLKGLNKGRFVEDLYEARAHIWSIFQRGKIKCWA